MRSSTYRHSKDQLHVVPRPLSLLHELLFKYTPLVHDAIEAIGNTAVFVSGSLWSFLWSFAIGGISLFQGRPVQMSSIEESTTWIVRIQFISQLLRLLLPSIVGGMVLVARCVSCDGIDGATTDSMQWAGVQTCYNANQNLLSLMVAVVIPLMGIGLVGISVFPLIIALDIFYSTNNVGGVANELSFRGAHLYTFFGGGTSYENPLVVLTSLLWRIAFVVTHVIFRSTDESINSGYLLFLPSVLFKGWSLSLLTGTEVFLTKNLIVPTHTFLSSV